MSVNLNLRIIETIKEIAEDNKISSFLIEILQEESRNTCKDKRYWQYKDFYRKTIDEYM